MTVELYANGEATGETMTLSSGNSWTGVFEDLPAYSYDKSSDAVEIAYTLVENKVEDYEAGYSVSGSDDCDCRITACSSAAGSDLLL